MDDNNINQNEQIGNNSIENQGNLGNSKKPKTNVILVVIIVILLCFINAGVGYYFGTKSNSESNSSDINQKNDSKNNDKKKDSNKEDMKELFNDKDIKVLLDKDGEAFITYSEIDADNKSIVSNVKSYLLVQAGQSDVCEGNKRLLFILNDGTVSSLNIDLLVCGKKLEVKNKIANLSNVVAIRESFLSGGTNEPENHIVYAQTNDSKEYNITKVLTGESKTAELNKENEKKEEKNDMVKAYKSNVDVSSILSQMGYNKMNVVPIYNSPNEYVVPGEVFKDGDKTLYISCSFALTTTQPNCNDKDKNKYYGSITVYPIDGYYIMLSGQTGGGSIQIFNSSLKEILSADYNPDSDARTFAIVSGGVVYQDGECEGTRSDGMVGNVDVVHFFSFKTNTDKVLFNVDHDAGWVC